MESNYRFVINANNVGVITVTDPMGNIKTVNFLTYNFPCSSAAFPASIVEPLGNVTTFSTLIPCVISAVQRPEGYRDEFGYDARTNITLVTHKAKAGSGLSDQTETAVFPATCANTLTCNRPTSYTDRNGNTTSYAYAPEHGGILTETRPPDSAGIRPVKRFRCRTLRMDTKWLKWIPAVCYPDMGENQRTHLRKNGHRGRRLPGANFVSSDLDEISPYFMSIHQGEQTSAGKRVRIGVE